METITSDYAFLCVMFLVGVNTIALLTFEFIWRKKHPEMYSVKTAPKTKYSLMDKYNRMLGIFLLIMGILWSLLLLTSASTLATNKWKLVGYILAFLVFIANIIFYKLGKNNKQ